MEGEKNIIYIFSTNHEFLFSGEMLSKTCITLTNNNNNNNKRGNGNRPLQSVWWSQSVWNG